MPDTSDAKLRQLMPYRKDIGFAHEKTGVPVELHWRLFVNPHAMNQSSITDASRMVTIGEAAKLRTLGEEDLFTYLCVHGALHLWNRLKWLADVGAILANETRCGIERLKNGAETRGAGRAANQAIFLCHLLLGSPLPSTLGTTFGPNSKMKPLERLALKAMTVRRGEQEWRDVPFATSLGSLSAFLLGQTWRYRLAELRKLLIKDTDLLTVPLPERLNFLYPILRLPLWICRRARRLLDRDQIGR
jgi:hypothetical protein